MVYNRVGPFINHAPPPLNGANMNHIEDGIAAAHALAEEAGGPVAWEDVTGKPTTFPPSAHTHDGTYAPVNHNHDGVYAPVAHNHDGVYAPASLADHPMLRKSGWRSLDPATWIVNGWTASGVYVKRSGDLIELRVYGLNGTASTSTQFTNALPQGFRYVNVGIPTASHGPLATISNTATGANSAVVLATGANGDLLRTENRTLTAGRFVMIGTTTEAWAPVANYPGTPV